MSNVISGLAQKSRQASPIRSTDKLHEDGMYYCSICGEARTKRVKFPFGEMTVHCVCKCDAEAIAKDRAEEKRKESQIKIDEIRASSLMDGKFYQATFAQSQERESDAVTYAAAKRYVRKFDAMYQSGQGILFYGSTGSGKTHLAACIANAIMSEQMRPVCMTSFVRLLELEFSERDKAEGAMAASDLLIIDDLGAERDTPYASETVYRVIDTRYRSAKPLIVTTNLTTSELGKPNNPDFKRIYERILERCYPIAMTGPSWRMKKAKDSISEMRKTLFED